MSKSTEAFTEAERKIIATLDIRAEYTELGVRFASDQPNASGWLTCYARFRDGDTDPSAAVCISGDNGSLGRYVDSGSDQSYNLWEFAVAAGRFTDWRVARAHFAVKAGITLPAGGGKGKPSAAKRKSKVSSKPNPLFAKIAVLSEEASQEFIEQWTASKPPITADSVKVANGRAVIFPKNESKKSRHHCIVFLCRRELDGPITAVILFRADGELFPAIGRLKERRMHLVGKSKDSWLVVGGKEAIATASTIWKVEGPTDAIALHHHLPAGHAVVTGCTGAGSGPKLPLSMFEGKTVHVIGDADTVGQVGVAKFAGVVAGKAREVKIVRLPFDIEEKHGRDLRDFFTEGGTFDRLQELAEQAKPVELLTAEKVMADRDIICNAVSLGDADSLIPVCMPIILNQIRELTGGWPRRIGNGERAPMFVDDKSRGVQLITATEAFFGYIGTVASTPPQFYSSAGMHTKGEVFSEWRRFTHAYDAVELLPHHLLIESHYYRCEIPEPGNGETLNKLLDRFSPETPIDRDLILAMFASVVWGGRGGARPAFVVTSDAGRGTGKSTLVMLLSRLFGGHFDISPREDIAAIKKRLLTAEAATRRIALIDNVKSLKFSWSDLEALITSPTISGHQMYIGEGTRPNTLTYVITLNGPSLSTDVAQRSIIIKLSKPTHSGNWEAETAEFIDQNRDALIADLIGFLQADCEPLLHFTRWAAWERDVLARLPEPAEAQAVIAERQGDADVEAEEGELIEAYFAERLQAAGFDIEDDRIFISSPLAVEWYNRVMNERHTTSAVSRILKQKANEGGFRNLKPLRRRDGRGFEWTGSNVGSDSRLLIASDQIEHQKELKNAAQYNSLG